MYEIQILEFGQIPRQLFTRPHPPRFAGLVPTMLPLNMSTSSLEESIVSGESALWPKCHLLSLKKFIVMQAHKKKITAVSFHPSHHHEQALSVSLDGFLKTFRRGYCMTNVWPDLTVLFFYRLENGKQVLSVNPASSSPLTAYLPLPESNTIVLGTLQNEIALYQLDCCRLEHIFGAHDDHVTALGILLHSIISEPKRTQRHSFT